MSLPAEILLLFPVTIHTFPRVLTPGGRRISCSITVECHHPSILQLFDIRTGPTLSLWFSLRIGLICHQSLGTVFSGSWWRQSWVSLEHFHHTQRPARVARHFNTLFSWSCIARDLLIHRRDDWLFLAVHIFASSFPNFFCSLHLLSSFLCRSVVMDG